MGVSASNNATSYYHSKQISKPSKSSTAVDPVTDPTTVHVTSSRHYKTLHSKSSCTYSEHKEKLRQYLASHLSGMLELNFKN